MKYFIDTEFLEGAQSKTFCGIKYKETKPTIDLISIGIVAEDGREYYAISKDFNLKEAWNRHDIKTKYNPDRLTHFHPGKVKYKDYWIRDNVLKPIWRELVNKELQHDYLAELENPFTYKGLNYLINKYGKTNKQIAEEVIKFVRTDKNTGIYFNSEPTFYGYYSDYDWVVFCWLFGKMIDLPKGFPMYCIDLKQILDEKNKNFKTPKGVNVSIEGLHNYPKQTNEHNALSDARWNKQLYEFLNKI